METALRRELFWDIDEKKIRDALTNSPRWVIVRVFQYGELTEIAEIIRYYGKQKVKDVLQSEKLKPMAQAMAYYFLDLDL